MTRMNLGRKFFNVEIKASSKQGDIDISEIFEKSFRNQIYHYWANKSTLELIEVVSKKTNIPKKDLFYKVLVAPRKPVYYANPIIAEEFRRWCQKPKKNRIEEAIQVRLKEKLNGEIGVTTDVGAIDVLTKNLLIEVKFFKDWKEGVGQLMVYGLEYKDHQKVLYLFGQAISQTKHDILPELRTRQKKDGSNKLLCLELIRNKCQLLDIKVDWDNELGTELDEYDE